MHIELADEEKAYLRENVLELVTQSIWRQVAPEIGWSNPLAAPLAMQYRSKIDEVKVRATLEANMVLQELQRPFVRGAMDMNPGMPPTFETSKLLEIAFSHFAPGTLGLIDYHGPHRLFGREHVANINVDLNALKEQRKQSSIYNYNAKYSNVKSEMAGLYVREAISRQADGTFNENESVTKTQKELFQTFFPDKEFLGPQPTVDGTLEFPVRVGGREDHDLDELSSGEKEILYGYLRLRNSAPKFSIILLDEPELHLNPGLTRRLPDFYNRHLAVAQQNQVWLITHSDAMLRESVGKTDYSVFHMGPSAYRADGENQAKAIVAARDFDAAVVDLVGDLAVYKPGAKLVLFEGSEDSEFDVRMTSELFPRFAAQVNCVSGSNKQRVKGLYEALERMTREGAIPMKVYAITDPDADSPTTVGANELKWGRYHIENYLLEPSVVARVLNDAGGLGTKFSETDAEEIMLQAARETLAPLVVHKVQSEANNQTINALRLRVNQNSVNVADDVAKALDAAMSRVAHLRAGPLSDARLRTYADEILSRYEDDLLNGEWRNTFRGRSILKRIAGKHGNGLSYALFRNQLLGRMRDQGIEPPGMKSVLTMILAET